jgi:hypothetical protein
MWGPLGKVYNQNQNLTTETRRKPKSLTTKRTKEHKGGSGDRRDRVIGTWANRMSGNSSPMSRYTDGPDFPMPRSPDFPIWALGGKSPLNHLICPAAKSCMLLNTMLLNTRLLDTRWSNEEDDQRDREWRDAPE